MATRRCLHSLTRFISSNPSFQFLKPLTHLRQALTLPDPFSSPILTANLRRIPTYREPICHARFSNARHLSSDRRDVRDEDEDESELGEDDEEEDEDDDEGEVDYEDHDNVSVSKGNLKRTYTPEEKDKEAAAIGYKVIGPLDRSDKPFKPYEPVFAVVQIGSHQFKVSNGDCIYTERLKFCEVNDRLILNRVLMLGSKTQTIIGRPILPDAAVHAVVEEHALDAKVIIFKKKRRKNYRRTKGHRQELTRSRIIDIQGIEKPEKTASGKTDKAAVKRPEKVPVAA